WLSAEFFIKRLNDQMIDALLFQQLDALIHGGEKLQVVVVGLQHHAWMRKKSEHDAFAFFRCCNFREPCNDSLVPGMNAIKSTNSRYCMIQRFKFFDALVDFHN